MPNWGGEHSGKDVPGQGNSICPPGNSASLLWQVQRRAGPRQEGQTNSPRMDSFPAMVPGFYLVHCEALEMHFDHIWPLEMPGEWTGRVQDGENTLQADTAVRVR